MSIFFLIEKLGYTLSKEFNFALYHKLRELLNHHKRQIRKLAGFVIRNIILN